ncbi:DUF2510 domain-containing protein [Demequina capsici]|uniref:DUF2510 domain-containing protein n=1 Tax=Demequina capsici TaxID=3075620 RepID=UPI0035E3FC0C
MCTCRPQAACEGLMRARVTLRTTSRMREPQVSQSPEAGWYNDPNDPSTSRWWDGANWTDHTKSAEPVPSVANTSDQTRGSLRGVGRIVAALAVVAIGLLILMMFGYALSMAS